MALLFDLVLVLVQARLSRWRDADRGGGDGRHWISGFFRRARMDTAGAGAIRQMTLAFLGSFGGAIEFIFEPRSSVFAGSGNQVGGLGEVGELMAKQIEVSALALAVALLLAFPLGVYLGHHGKGEMLAIAIGNAGRAIPELAVIAFMVAFVGLGLLNVTIALMILGIPPILTNTFVGIRQVDRDAVEAARGIGMTEFEIARKVELPLAVPTIMGGVRTAAVNIIATATIASLAGVTHARRLHHQRQRLRRGGPDRRSDPGRAPGARGRAPARRPATAAHPARGGARASARHA